MVQHGLTNDVPGCRPSQSPFQSVPQKVLFGPTSQSKTLSPCPSPSLSPPPPPTEKEKRKTKKAHRKIHSGVLRLLRALHGRTSQVTSMHGAPSSPGRSKHRCPNGETNGHKSRLQRQRQRTPICSRTGPMFIQHRATQCFPKQFHDFKRQASEGSSPAEMDLPEATAAFGDRGIASFEREGKTKSIPRCFF